VGLRRSGLAEQHQGREMRQLQDIWSLLYRSDHVIAEGLKLARQQDLLPAADHLCSFLEGSLTKGRRGPMPAASR
jgi:UDP-N-acetylglucosamine acyltransferase